MLAKLPFRDLKAIAEAWCAAEDLDSDAIAPITHAVARHREIAAEVNALDEGTEVRLIARRLAAGEISFAAAVAEHGAANAAKEPVSVSNRMRRGVVVQRVANTELQREATEFLRVNIHALLADVDAASRKVQDEYEKLPALTGVSSATEAIRSGGRAPSSWAKSQDLVPRQSALAEARRVLRRYVDDDGRRGGG